ncbi:hypothetical protein DPMN_016313 [Dreissena polymorpha]|uniref:Uncharacterized protein n=1 Tax=Dreissena polymorpha TaxID=45954 RepID=A0A9D4S4H1_DREPO|nr:hypothetical protein DPMN_016313 [Dreissena polymorpha]
MEHKTYAQNMTVSNTCWPTRAPPGWTLKECTSLPMDERLSAAHIRPDWRRFFLSQ